MTTSRKGNFLDSKRAHNEMKKKKGVNRCAEREKDNPAHREKATNRRKKGEEYQRKTKVKNPSSEHVGSRSGKAEEKQKKVIAGDKLLGRDRTAKGGS